MIDPTDMFQRQWEDQDPLCAEINRLTDENEALKALVRDLTSAARRDRSLIIRKFGHHHLIDTHVTKGQVLKSIELTKEGQGDG